MPEEIDILKLVCRKLEDTNVRYMLTGSLAANFYAVPRMTRDIDFVVEILNPEVEKFFQVFHNEFYIDKVAIQDALKYESMFNIIHNTTIFKIDFIIRKSSSYRSVEFERRRRIELDGIPVWIVSPEDLIISKLLWAKDSWSELQLKDVKNLCLSIKNLDKSYLQNWIEELNLKKVYEKITAYG